MTTTFHPGLPEIKRPEPVTAHGELQLRIVGGEHHGRTIRLQAAKCTVGSAPGCTLRLKTNGIEPVHCLILRGPNGTVVRRLGEDAELNGQRFDDAPLNLGDRLRLGDVTFVIASDTGSQREPVRRLSPRDQRELEREQVGRIRRSGHRRARALIQELRKHKSKVRELSLSVDRRKVDLDRLSQQLSQAQRDLTSERERHLQDLETHRSSALHTNQLSHSVERLRQELFAAQTQHQKEGDLWRLERARSVDELSARDRQLHQLQSDLQQRQWDVDQLQAQLTRQQRQLELEHEQAAIARTRHQHDLESFKKERSTWQDDLTDRDRQLVQLRGELEMRLREVEQLRDEYQRLKKVASEEQALLKLELDRYRMGNTALDQERTRHAADLLQRERQIGDLQNQLASQQGELARLQRELASRQQELGEFRRQTDGERKAWEIDRLHILNRVSEAVAHDANLLTDRQRAADELASRLQTLEEELRERTQEVERQQTDLRLLRQQEVAWQRERSELLRSLQEQTQQSEELRQQKERLEEQLASLGENTPGAMHTQTFVAPNVMQTQVIAPPDGITDLGAELQREATELRKQLREAEAQLQEFAAREQVVAERQQAVDVQEQALTQMRERLAEQEAANCVEAERLVEATRRLEEYERQLTAQGEELVRQQEALAAQALPAANVVAPNQAEVDLVHGQAVGPVEDIPIGVSAVDFRQAEEELAQLREALTAQEGQPPGIPTYEPSVADEEAGFLMPTLEGDAFSPRERDVVAPVPEEDKPPVDEPKPAAAAASQSSEEPLAPPADDVPSPDVSPEMLPHWAYEHEKPTGMDTIANLRWRNNLDEHAEGAADSSQKSPALASSDDEPAPPVDDILERLRSAGILKDGGGEPSRSAVHRSSDDTFAARLSEPEVASPAEEEPEVPVAAYSPPAAPNPFHAAAPAAPASGEEDDSIESYMQQLMSRVRGDQPAGPNNVSISGPNPVYKAAAAPLNPAEPILPAAPPQPVTPVKPEEYIPRSQAPEQSISMAAMRELANSQARSAISRHQASQGKQQIGGKLLATVAAIVIGLLAGYWGLQSGSWPALTAAGLCLMISAYWGLQILWLAGSALGQIKKEMMLPRPDVSSGGEVKK